MFFMYLALASVIGGLVVYLFREFRKEKVQRNGQKFLRPKTGKIYQVFAYGNKKYSNHFPVLMVQMGTTELLLIYHVDLPVPSNAEYVKAMESSKGTISLEVYRCQQLPVLQLVETK